MNPLPCKAHHQGLFVFPPAGRLDIGKQTLGPLFCLGHPRGLSNRQGLILLVVFLFFTVCLNVDPKHAAATGGGNLSVQLRVSTVSPQRPVCGRNCGFFVRTVSHCLDLADRAASGA